MSERTQQRGDAETLLRGPLWKSAAYSMKPGDFQVIADSSDGAVVITLPAMAEAVPGRVYTVYAPSGASNDVSVNIKETATEISTYGDLDADGDTISVVCSGLSWVVVGSVLG